MYKCLIAEREFDYRKLYIYFVNSAHYKCNVFYMYLIDLSSISIVMLWLKNESSNIYIVWLNMKILKM